jgi:WD40 repeat protein
VAILVSAPIPEGSPGGQPHYIPSLAWNPDGVLIAIKFPLALEFYDTASYEKVAAISEPSINDKAWNPAGKYLVTGDMKGTLRFWGIKSPQ